MKKIFIPAYNKTSFDLKKISEKIKDLPEKIFIAYSIQYKDSAEKIKNSLDKEKISGFSQVLGCSKPKIPSETKSILLIGSGRFHGVSLAIETELTVYILNINEKKLNKISEKDIQKFNSLKKSAYLKYLNSEKIGILVSLKSGQEQIKKAIQFQDSLKNKKAYIFIADLLNLSEIENFSGIDSWVNTACPRLSFDNPQVINLKDIK